MAIHKIDGVDGTNHFPKKFVTLYTASTSIAKGQFVAIDLADTTNGLGASVKLCPAGAASNQAGDLCFGVATETIDAAGNITIQTAGKFENAYVVNGVEAGDALVGTLNGEAPGSACAQTAATFDGPVVAYSLQSEGSSGATPQSGTDLRADIMIIDQGLF